MTARNLYERGSWFLPQGRLFIFANDMPPITPTDVYQNLVKFTMPFAYVSAEAMALPKDQRQPNWRLERPEIKALCKTSRAVAAFTHLVLRAFTPHAVKDCERVQEDSRWFVQDGGEERSIIREMFKITHNPSDIILSKDIRYQIPDSYIPAASHR